MRWHSPLPLRCVESADSNSFLYLPEGTTALPLAPHVGSFGHARGKHVHEGVDLYCPNGTPVFAVEDGSAVACLPFTGAIAGSPWWKDTYALLVEGESGVVVYGEIDPLTFELGAAIRAGDTLGYVTEVLDKNKGRPRSMLHMELHQAGTRDVYEWSLPPQGMSIAATRPPSLLDPTPRLRAMAQHLAYA